MDDFGSDCIFFGRKRKPLFLDHKRDMMHLLIKILFRPFGHIFPMLKQNDQKKKGAICLFRRVVSAGIAGIDVFLVHVEVDVSNGLPCFHMVGYISAQVKEAQDRVRTALKNVGISLPPKKITVNLAPADVRKDGSGFDLPIAAAILSAIERVPEHALQGVLLVGELGLNGQVHAVPGILPMVIEAKKRGCRLCIVPEENLNEARVISKIPSIGIRSLQELIEYLSCGVLPKEEKKVLWKDRGEYNVDFADIHGQDRAKRAALIAVSGFHNLLMTGPPGTGKTMIAKRIPTILPLMTKEESLEVSHIYSVAGLLTEEQPYMVTRPFCAPHHTVTPQALAGGGLVPRPGLISQSHRGCLFIDEIAEFSRASLEILREPLEERKITISRTGGTYVFPAEFILVAAMNPCPCGYYPDMNRCMCSQREIRRYRSKISFPLLDRIDLCTEVAAVEFQDLQRNETDTQNSAEMRKKVMQAHRIQKVRYKDESFFFNGGLPPAKIGQYCPMTKKAQELIGRVYEKQHLSARSYHRVIRIARTIADLEGADVIEVPHVSEAVYYRGMERQRGGF